MGVNYLKKYYLDDGKLAQRARLEFFRALSTGRMIAFTGSMATQAFGYGSWDQLCMSVSALAADAVRKGKLETSDERKILKQIMAFEKRGRANAWSAPVGMSMVEEALGRARLRDGGALPKPSEIRGEAFALDDAQAWPLDRADTLQEVVRAALAQRFRAPNEAWWVGRFKGVSADEIRDWINRSDPRFRALINDFDARFNVLKALSEGLGIRRFTTPSYDFELERTMMLADHEVTRSPFDSLLGLRLKAGENFSWDLGSGRIRRVFADGWAIESDLLNRERIDRMIEFAVGTDDVDAHVMHLHGRACNWRSMIVTQGDYDALYRRNDLNKAPFEFAKRLMMGGNPILFVGLGMSEAELNRELQEFVSDNPYQRVAPTFLLWSTRPGEMDANAKAGKRIDFLRRLGVLTIFDDDLAPRRPVERDARGDRLNADGSKYVGVGGRFVSARDGFVQAEGNLSVEYIDGAGRFDVADRSSQEDLEDLRSSVAPLIAGLNGAPDPAVNPTVREMEIGDRWRSMAGRIEAAGGAKPEPVRLWSVLNYHDGAEIPLLKDLIAAAAKHHVVCVIGPQGCGKGSLARALSEAPPQALKLRRPSDCLVINGGFSFDTDTLLEGAARFFESSVPPGPAEGAAASALESRSSLFSRLEMGRPVKDANDPRALVIVNGMERFFDTAGQPLSAELDELLAISRASYGEHHAEPAGGPMVLADRRPSRVRWVLFGTERVRSYMENIGAKIVEFEGAPDAAGRGVPGCYTGSVWEWLKACFPGDMPQELRGEVYRYEANGSGRISGDSIDLRRAFYGSILEEAALRRILGANGAEADDVGVARAILKALAFIGLPVEKDLIRLMPALRAHGQVEFDRAFDALVAMKLVLELDGYRHPESSSDRRFALHRSFLTELRYRYGIPLSEAKLSTAFNMSLYVAQPIDGDIPDTDIHDELGDSIDELIGSYRSHVDMSRPLNERLAGLPLASADSFLAAVAAACGSSAVPSSAAEAHAILDLVSDRYGRALRAALALVRSYYSTTGLLTLDSGDRLIREGRDGVLLEHAERLDDLIDAYGKRSLAQKGMLKALTDELLGPDPKTATDTQRAVKTAEARALIAQAFPAPEPFYPDELVWLHNERGVVRLAMGDLYEARRSFDQALLVNRRCVEGRDRAHNWRRIRLNQLSVDIEMGNIGVAERKCEELITFSRGRYNLREDRLAVAIAQGYQGWCHHLRGRADLAIRRYVEACDELSGLNEIRAQAYFERLRANALGMINKPDEQQTRLETALDLAQSAVQMDIVHRLQITLADSYLFSSKPTPDHKRRRAYRYLEDALTYALHTDVHRLRCEASLTTARARLWISDYDGALRFATDALMVASRYGMELRKISIRALIAKIMAERGHPVTAEHLARTCIKMATRRRYQNAIDQANRVITDIPRISSAISRSDMSGRRNF